MNASVLLLILSIIWSLVAALLPESITGLPRLLIVLPVIFALPGYALSIALLPARYIDALGRVVYSLGLSLAVAATGAFVLNVTETGISRLTWSIWLAAVTIVASVIAIARLLVLRPAAAQRTAVRLSLYDVVVIALGAGLLVGSVVIARIIEGTQLNHEFTQFWLIPLANGHVEISIHNSNDESETYIVELQLDGEVDNRWDNLTLEPSGEWVMKVPLAANFSGTIEATLYRSDAPQDIYRHAKISG